MGEPNFPTRGGAAPAPSWREPLAELERTLAAASRAVALLRGSLEPEEPTLADEPAAEQSNEEARNAAFERLWERIDHERLEQQAEAPPERKAPRGLDLLPQQYLVTIEDRESAVDLVPIHRALLGLAKMEDVSLVSYANGAPVISLRVQGELEHERLREAIAAATDRQCELID